jgi:ectoine hydroxylase-related dioxygenase (phytanoyl-CoA dioxygenase family)
MSAAESAPFPSLDFERYHREELPARLAAGRAPLVAKAARGLAPFAFRLREDGRAFTYRPTAAGVELVAGDAAATSVIELERAAWEALVHELEAPAGLLYAGRLRCLRGQGMDAMAWEPALRALYNGVPPWDAQEAAGLRDRNGRLLDPEATFTPESAPADMAHFLATAGYLLVRDVFRPDEVAGFLAEAAVLAREARKGDKLSWWCKDARGEERLCRVTRAASQPRLGALPRDPRVLALAALAEQRLEHKRGEGDGVTIIWKIPGVSEGMGDLPWHRDCGMGGHAVMCPTLICSIYLTEASPETGELVFLPGSTRRSAVQVGDPRDPRSPRGAHFHARPGDVSLHYGDTLHAAPPPSRDDLAQYRVSAILGFARPGAHHHRGESSYNAVLHQRDDGQVEHLAKRAERV